MAKYADTPVEDIQALYNDVKASFDSHKTLSLEYRKTQLKSLAFMIQDNEQALVDAVHADLNRVGHETIVSEIIPLIHEVKYALSHLDKWAKPEKVKTTAAWALAKATLTSVPKGTALIISPWNFPLSLSLGPLVGAISAGCPAILKPAEQTPAVSALLADLFPRYLDQSSYKIVLGAVPQATKLLDLRWDLIFYTGSGSVGRIVAAAAARHLTPCVLELGGKSPAIVLDDCNVDITAKRLMWGKWTNAGQICIAPDYVLCTPAMQPKLVEAMRKAVVEFTGAAKSQSSVGNDQYSKLIAPNHFARIDSLLSKTKGSIAIGGTRDEKRQKIDVTVVTDVKLDDSLMEGEIFGPVLPIVPMASLDEMLRYINQNDNPLALYAFTSNNAKSKHIFDHTRSGGFVQNDCLIQFSIPGLPFGGAGPSGYGEYHGKFSFDAFSHKRSSASMPPYLDVLLASRYPPYTAAKLKRLSMLTRETVKRSTGSTSSLARLLKVISALLAIITAYKRLFAK